MSEMTATRMDASADGRHQERRKSEEFRTWLFLTLFMAPILAVALVGTYGLIVWMYHALAGPPAM